MKRREQRWDGDKADNKQRQLREITNVHNWPKTLRIH
jgi:hypothetical protein